MDYCPWGDDFVSRDCLLEIEPGSGAFKMDIGYDEDGDIFGDVDGLLELFFVESG